MYLYLGQWNNTKIPVFLKFNYIFVFYGDTDVSNCSFVQFQIWDLPGADHVNIFDTANFDTESIIMGCAAIVFVIDAQVCWIVDKHLTILANPNCQSNFK